MAELVAVNMRKKTGNEDFELACRGSQEPFNSLWAANNETACVS